MEQGQDEGLVPHGKVTLVLWVKGNSCISQQSFRACGSYRDGFSRTFHGIPNGVELSLDWFRFYLQIRQGRATAHTPVYQPLAAIDQALVVELDKYFPDGSRKALVQREALSRPIARTAEQPQLFEYRVPTLLFPFPNPFLEGFATEVLAGLSFRCQLSFHDKLRANTGVVGPGQPERVKPLHSSPSNDDVMKRVYQHVPHMQGASDVGGWDDNREGRLR